MSDAVTAAQTTNSAQSGDAPIPNVDRQAPAPAPTPAPAPAPNPEPAPAPAANPAPAEAPQIGTDPAAAPEGPTSADAVDGVITYEPTGDAGLDVALQFVGRLGVGMDDPAMMATADGDFSLIKAKLATMGDKAVGWEQMVALAEQAHGRHVETTTARNTAIASAVSGVLGEGQAEILAWASQNADDAERADINAMLRASPTQARAAANILLQAYQAAGGTVVSPASATSGSASAGAAPSQSDTGPMTNKMFATESAKLHRQYGNAYTQTPEYRGLLARLGR